jgi:hypothetical protein
MKNILILSLGLAIGAGGVWLFERHRHTEAPEHAEAVSEEAHSEAGTIKVATNQQAAAGLKIEQPESASFSPEIKGYGRVLDPSALVMLEHDVTVARASLEASSRDFERVKVLYGQNQNASARALETADALLKRDRAQLAASEVRRLATFGPKLSQREDLPDILNAVARMEWALVRVDVPPGLMAGPPSKFRVAPLANEQATFDAELLGVAPLADPSMQGQGFLGLIKTNGLSPNIAVAGWIEDLSRKVDGFVVPSGAVLLEGGKMIVLVQVGPEAFRKLEIEIDRPVKDGVFVTSGISASNRVVTAGAHQILSVTRAESAE